jgi:hypothetical protein
MHGAANVATPIVLPDVDRVVWLVLGGVIYAIGVGAYLLLRQVRAPTAPTAVPAGVTTDRMPRSTE